MDWQTFGMAIALIGAAAIVSAGVLVVWNKSRPTDPDEANQRELEYESELEADFQHFTNSDNDEPLRARSFWRFVDHAGRARKSDPERIMHMITDATPRRRRKSPTPIAKKGGNKTGTTGTP